MSPQFYWLEISVVFLNTVSLLATYHPDTMARSIISLVFVGLFLIFSGIKLLGFGFRYYFYQGWNQVEFAAVALTLVSCDARPSLRLNLTMALGLKGIF